MKYNSLLLKSIFIVFLLTACINFVNAQNVISKKGQATLKSCEKYFAENNDAHLKEFIEFTSIPSISSIPAHKPDIEKAAAWIIKKLQAIGLTTVQLIPTEGNPVVYGCWVGAKDKPTVLIYAHYDVQPVKEAEWNHPPFAGEIENGRIYARGASDDKSGVMIPIWAVEAMLKTNKSLPVNVKFIFEGEEEISSPHFQKFLIDNKELLKADFALNGDGSQINDSTAAILMSLRGSVKLEFTIKTANIDAHSGWYGGKTPNAAIDLAEIISSFYNKDGSIAVEGFYNNVLPMTNSEKEMENKFPYDSLTDRKILGTTAETGDTNFTPMERVWYRPTLEVTGLQSGYTGEGFSQIIPGSAMARVSSRLVYNQSGDDVIQSIIKHINKNCPVGATVAYKYIPGYIRPLKFPSGTRAYNYLSAVLTNVYEKPPVPIAVGYSTGSLIDIKEQLGIYPYSLGVQQPDEKAHGANEFLRLSSLLTGQMLYCTYFIYVGEQEGK